MEIETTQRMYRDIQNTLSINRRRAKNIVLEIIYFALPREIMQRQHITYEQYVWVGDTLKSAGYHVAIYPRP